MVMYFIAIFILLFSLVSAVPPETVAEINLSAYLGRWYQAYASLIPNQTYEKDGFCVTADYYSPTDDKGSTVSFKVMNSQRYPTSFLCSYQSPYVHQTL